MMGRGPLGGQQQSQAVTNYAEDGIDDDEDVVAEVRGTPADRIAVSPLIAASSINLQPALKGFTPHGISRR